MDPRAIKKVEDLLDNKCACMIAEHFGLNLNSEGCFPRLAMSNLEGLQDTLLKMGFTMMATDIKWGTFPQIWEGYVRSLSDGVSSWSDHSFIVIQDPWDRRREIPISTEVAAKALVLGGFP